jgi:hypothetical protein
LILDIRPVWVSCQVAEKQIAHAENRGQQVVEVIRQSRRESAGGSILRVRRNCSSSTLRSVISAGAPDPHQLSILNDADPVVDEVSGATA